MEPLPPIAIDADAVVTWRRRSNPEPVNPELFSFRSVYGGMAATTRCVQRKAVVLNGYSCDFQTTPIVCENLLDNGLFFIYNSHGDKKAMRRAQRA
jgi:hypothetical protein